MTIAVIPSTPNGQSYWRQVTALGGRDYLLTFRWNQRSGRWTVDVATESGNMIAAGRALVPLMPVLRGVRDDRAPEGTLVLVDQQESAEGLGDPTFTSLGARHVLLFLDEEDAP